jgi:hypothetical protein
MTDAGNRGAVYERFPAGQVMHIRPFHWRSAVAWRGLATL